MAAHLLRAITDVLMSTVTKQYLEDDYELLIQNIGYAFPFHQLSLDEYDEIKGWCKTGIFILKDGDDWTDHQLGFLEIARKIIIRLYPEWVKLGYPETYEDWMIAKYPPEE